MVVEASLHVCSFEAITKPAVVDVSGIQRRPQSPNSFLVVLEACLGIVLLVHHHAQLVLHLPDVTMEQHENCVVARGLVHFLLTMMKV